MKILVPYDGSRYSLSTLQLVASMALVPGSEITILYVAHAGAFATAMQNGMDPVKEQEALISYSKQLDELSRELALWQKECVVNFRIRFGPIAETILKTVEEDGYDLLVMGSHGKKRLSSLVFGSVSRTVLINATRPVLIVKPTEAVRRGEMGAHGYKVLVPIDNSQHSVHTIDWLTCQAWKEGTRIKLLHVVPEFKDLRKPNGVSEQLELLHQKWLLVRERLHEALENHALKLGEVVGMSNIEIEVCPGEPKDEILRAEQEWLPDIIAMGSRSKPGLNRILSKSVSAFVGRNCECAELIVYHNHMYSLPKPRVEKADNTSYDDPVIVQIRETSPHTVTM